MKVKVRDVHPNPYRNIDHYPLNKEKIMALTKSIEKTGFWDNLVGRKQDGKIQIAYGHHRIEALRLAEGYGYDFEFDLPVREIDNGTMIQIMASENMQEWEHSIGVTDETIKVTRDYLISVTGDSKVSPNDIANFLGWSSTRVKYCLRRIDFIDSGNVDKESVESLPSESHAAEFSSSVYNKSFTSDEQKEVW